MLVLSRKVGEKVVLPQSQVTISILDASRGRVRLGITAPDDVAVHRAEVWQRAAAAAAIERGDPMKALRILIADRDNFLSGTYREHLCRFGAEVMTAATGIECLARLRDFSPHVLVLDPELPWGGGEGVLALIDSEPELRPGAVFLLTYGKDRGLMYRISAFHCDDYEIKPLSPRRLVEKLYSLCVVHSKDTADLRGSDGVSRGKETALSGPAESKSGGIGPITVATKTGNLRGES